MSREAADAGTPPQQSTHTFRPAQAVTLPLHRNGGQPQPLTFREAASVQQQQSTSATTIGTRGNSPELAEGERLTVPHSPPSMTRAYFGENPWQVSTKPTLIVVLGAMLFALVCTWTLQMFVLSTLNHVGVFAMGSYVVYSSYYMVHYYLEGLSTSFRKVSKDKKFYTISNMIKAGVLVAITPFACHQLWCIVVYDEWDTNTLRNLGCIYAIPDFVSLLTVRKMSYTTIVHHICVVAFNYFSLQNDYSEENVCRLIVVYAAFSTFAYSVNMLLASRFLGVPASVSKILSISSLCIYVCCCAINWTWQAYYLRRLITGPNNHWTIYVYMTLICFVMWDDIVLNKWLLQNAKNTGGFRGASRANINVMQSRILPGNHSQRPSSIQN